MQANGAHVQIQLARRGDKKYHTAVYTEKERG